LNLPEGGDSMFVIRCRLGKKRFSETAFRSQSSPCGFTLLELLVSVAIVGSIACLAIPATQSVREESRGNVCRSNLRQIALASHGYVAARGRFPPGHQGRLLGSTLPEDWSEASNNYAGHLGFFLPWLEEEAFYAELTTADPRFFSDDGRSGAWFLAPEAILALAPRSVASFRCVSDSSSAICPVIAAIDVYVRRSAVPLASVTNYLGCIGAPAATRVGDGDESIRGVFYSRSRVRPSDIADGLSKTILVGEVLGDSPEFHSEVIEARHSLLCGGVSTFSFGRAPDRTMSGVAEAVMYRSRHPGAVNLGFADGSVRALDVEAAITVVRSLATRAGGESIEPAAY
jgi:prepilin-type N-terminal cleavage/methylation domain-containing protein/prepilin-type processing-associated H-X9-DG protein